MITIATTLHAYVMDQVDTWKAWTYNAEQIRDSHPDGVTYFAAIESDARGLGMFAPLLERLEEIGGTYWEFRFDDGAEQITTKNRLRRITMGQNVATTFAVDAGSSHMLFMAADCAPPPDALPKLLDMHWPIVGGEVTTYCLSGPDVERHPTTGQMFGFPVQMHMATAAFVMLQRDLMKQVHWRQDGDKNMSDDPCMHADALALGYPTLVRKDCIGQHFPLHVGAIETRGHDMTHHREAF